MTEQNKKYQPPEMARLVSDGLLFGIGLLGGLEALSYLLQGELGFASLWGVPALFCLWLAGSDVHNWQESKKTDQVGQEIPTTQLVSSAAGD